MGPVRITYDPECDILYVTFGQPTEAIGYQLSDQILLRVNPQTHAAAGLTVLNFSVHAHADRAMCLPALEENPEDTVNLLEILSSPPVCHFLRVADGEQGMSATLLNPSLEEAVVG